MKLTNYQVSTTSALPQGVTASITVKCDKLTEVQIASLARCELTRKMNADLRDGQKNLKGLHTWWLAIKNTFRGVYDANARVGAGTIIVDPFDAIAAQVASGEMTSTEAMAKVAAMFAEPTDDTKSTDEMTSDSDSTDESTVENTTDAIAA